MSLLDLHRSASVPSNNFQSSPFHSSMFSLFKYLFDQSFEPVLLNMLQCDLFLAIRDNFVSICFLCFIWFCCFCIVCFACISVCYVAYVILLLSCCSLIFLRTYVFICVKVNICNCIEFNKHNNCFSLSLRLSRGVSKHIGHR